MTEKGENPVFGFRSAGVRRVVALFLSVTGLVGCSFSPPQDTAGVSGEALFLRYCSGCHPQGRNLLYPQKDLRRLTLAANGITKPEDIVRLMRNPGRGMARFDRNAIPDAEAVRIGAYVLETFR